MVDWNGVCEFDAEGKFTRFKNSNDSSNAILRPIPQTKEVLEMASNADLEINELTKPIESKQFAVLFKRLTILCGTQKLSDPEYKILFSSYYEALKLYPFKIVMCVFKAYIEQAEGNDYLPKIGFLKSKMQEEYKPLQEMKRRNDLILGKSTQGNKISELSKLLVGIKGV